MIGENQAIRSRLRSWVTVAIPAVLIGPISAQANEDAALVVVPALLGVVWGSTVWFGLRFKWLRIVEAVAVVLALAAIGPPALGMYIVSVIGTAMTLTIGSASAIVVALTAAAIAAMGMLAPEVASDVPRYAIVIPGTVFFAFGRSLRSSTLAHVNAERVADEFGRANTLLENNLRSAARLATIRERTRIARELHDSLGHCLTAAHVHLQLVGNTIGPGPSEAREALGKAQAATHHGIAELRRCVAVMRDRDTAKHLSQVMRECIDGMPVDGLVVKLAITGVERRLPPEREFVLFRGLQEALTNVTKHAGASEVEIKLDYTDAPNVRLSIRDDGDGSASTEGGYGLVGLAERVESVGGSICVRTEPGQGFLLKIEVAA